MTINNLQYLKGFFEACYGQKQSVTFDSDKVADILDRINGAITEATTPDKIIPAIQPAQIPLPFPAIQFQPYQPMPGITPFYPVQPTITPNKPQWPETNDQDKYRLGTTCETIDAGYSVMVDPSCSVGTERHDMKYGNVPMPDFSPLNSIPDPLKLDASTLSAYHDPLPTVSADKLAAIMRDETRAQKLEERRARSDERTANYGRPEKGYARD